MVCIDTADDGLLLERLPKVTVLANDKREGMFYNTQAVDSYWCVCQDVCIEE